MLPMQGAQKFLIIARHLDECARANSVEDEQINHSYWKEGNTIQTISVQPIPAYQIKNSRSFSKTFSK